MPFELRLRVALLGLRVGVGLVFVFWALDKIVQPEHSTQVFGAFYRMPNTGHTALLALGVAQLALTAAFLLGVAKRFSYGAVLVLHAISTLSSFAKYLEPFSSLLFFAAWPMLAACAALYLLRDYDTLATLGGSRSRVKLSPRSLS